MNEPIYSVLFEQITVKDMDTNIINFIKYMINFFFYRFGLEICFFMSAITIAIRMDAFAIMYSLWLGLFIKMKRERICKIWSVYLAFLLIAIAVQYAFCLGLPPFLCLSNYFIIKLFLKVILIIFNKIGYPWSAVNESKTLKLFRLWLYLPNYDPRPNSYLLIADFFQIFFVWLQLSVFQIETKADSPILEMSGTNKEIVYDLNLYNANPYHDFVSKYRNNFDKIKYAVYMYSYWVVLALIYITGTSRISLLCLGYVILSFFFLW